MAFCGYGRVSGRATGKTLKGAVKAIKKNFINDITTLKGVFHTGKFVRNAGRSYLETSVQTAVAKMFSLTIKNYAQSF